MTVKLDVISSADCFQLGLVRADQARFGRHEYSHNHPSLVGHRYDGNLYTITQLNSIGLPDQLALQWQIDRSRFI